MRAQGPDGVGEAECPSQLGASPLGGVLTPVPQSPSREQGLTPRCFGTSPPLPRVAHRRRGRGEGLASWLATAPPASGPDISPGPALPPAPHGAQGPLAPAAPASDLGATPPTCGQGPGRPGLGCWLQLCGDLVRVPGQLGPEPRTVLYHLVTVDPHPRGLLAHATRAR